MSFINLPLLTHIKPISPRPILLVVGEYAHSRYFSEDACELASDPKELYVVPNAGHGDLYDKTDLMPFDKLAEFFTKHLASNPDLAVAGASLDGQGEAVPDGYRAMADRESIKVRVTPWAAPALPERALASPRGRPSHFR